MTTYKNRTVVGLVKKLRDVRDKLNTDLANMTPEQRKAYFNNLREKSDILKNETLHG